MAQEPLDLTPYLEAAKAEARRIISVNPLIGTIVLDDWNTGERICGPRLVYEALCSSGYDCHSCALFQQVGEDTPSSDSAPRLRTSLCRPTGTQHCVFGDMLRTFLNCMWLGNYEMAYVLWFLKKCPKLDEFKAELKWVLGYRILVFNGETDDHILRKEEIASKIRVLEALISRLPHDALRRMLAAQAMDELLRSRVL